MSKANRNCSVPGCKTKKGGDPNIHFHKYPLPNSGLVNITNNYGIIERVDRRKAWAIKFKMGKPVGKGMSVCSKHFTPDDYIMKGCTTFAPKLKRTAVPSVNLPQSSIIIRKSQDERRAARHVKREELRTHTISRPSTPVSPMVFCVENQLESVNLINESNLNDAEKLCVSALMDLFEAGSSQKENSIHVSTSNKSVQVSSGDFIVSFTSGFKNEQQLNSVTGIHSFELLDTITKLIKKFYPDKKSHNLTVKDRIILVFMKLKLALSFVVISFLFKVSPSTCRVIFNEYVEALSNILKNAITWPPIEEIRKNIPACFKSFQNVRIVLDCTEIPVQRPKCLCCRIRMYSNYKGTYTVKIMTGVTPAGLITYLSKAYGGRSSDKSIFEKSKLIEKLTPHVDAIMVDKGFLIDKLCQENFIKILRPSFLRNKKQFSELEANENLLISKARVHVERLNQRIKIFKIFNSPLPWNMVGNIDNIFNIVVGLVNLQNPVLRDDKF